MVKNMWRTYGLNSQSHILTIYMKKIQLLKNQKFSIKKKEKNQLMSKPVRMSVINANTLGLLKKNIT